MDIRRLLGKEMLYFDGAMGTMLQKAGLLPGEIPETWNLIHPEKVLSIHQKYAAAGADIIKTNTFGANALKFKDTPLEVKDVVEKAVKIAQKAWDGTDHPIDRRFVALDMGPTGRLLEPYGDLAFEDAVLIYGEIVEAGKKDADLILIETMSDLYEAKAAILAAKEHSDLPVFVTFTFDDTGRLLSGADVKASVLTASALGADAVGFNCGLGPDLVADLMPRAASVTDLPLIANPNAGLPEEENGVTVYKVGPDDFAGQMQKIASCGASILGGCCGTTPGHIRRLKEKVAVFAKRGERKTRCAVCGSGTIAEIGKKAVVIGERINPTGKKLLKEALVKKDMDYVCRLAIDQAEKGADIIDVNMGLPGTDEKELLALSVRSIQSVLSLPLEIDTSNAAAMEGALRLYNGRPLLNSVSGTKESMEKVFPLAKKYGAAVVGLCLDESGIAGSAKGRLLVAQKIIDTARKYGLTKDDIIIDPLALTVGTGAENAKIALETVKALSDMGIATILGVSNISFGLPNRDAVNSAFFALALASGLKAAIINPSSARMMETLRAFFALSGDDPGCAAYAAIYGDMPKAAPAPAPAEDGLSLKDAVEKGLPEMAARAAKRLLAEKKEPLDIINGEIIPALDRVGDGFGKKTVFLPQLLMSADAAKSAFEVIKGAFAAASSAKKGTIVLAVVKGDIHDIGKNIVKALWENYGYEVADLGRDVDPEKVADEVLRLKSPLVGLTALMTTTVPAMEETIRVLKRKAPSCRILVGGAVLTQDYAERIGADAYAATAVAAVDYAKSVLTGA